MKEEKGYLNITSVLKDNNEIFRIAGVLTTIVSATLLAFRIIPWWCAAEVFVAGVFIMIPIRTVKLTQIVPTTVRKGNRWLEIKMEDMMFDSVNVRNERYRFALDDLEVCEDNGVVALYGNGYVQYSYRRKKNKLKHGRTRTTNYLLLGRIPDNIAEMLPKQAC